MTPTKKHPRRRQLLVIGAVVVIALLVAVVMLPNTKWAREFARELVSEAASDALHGTLAIRAIEGSFWGSLTLHDVAFVGTRGDTIASLPRLHVEYDLLPLLRKEIRLNLVVIDSLRLTLNQSDQGPWNFTEILPPSSSNSDSSGEAPSAWSVIVTSLTVRALSATISPAKPSPSIPEQLQRFDLEGSFLYTAQRWEASVMSCSLTTAQPLLHLHRFMLVADGNDRGASIDSLSLATDRIALGGSGTLTFPPERGSSISLMTSTLDFEEIGRFYPAFPLKMLPPTKLMATVNDGLLQWRAEVGMNEPQLTLEGTFARAESLTTTRIQAEFTRIDPAKWLVAQIPALSLSGSLSARTSLEDPLRHGAEFSLELGPSTIGGRSLTKAALDGTINGGDLAARISLEAESAQFSGRVNIGDLAGRQQLSTTMAVSNLDPYAVTDVGDLRGTLNGSVTLEGGPLDVERFTGSATLQTGASVVASFPFDSLLMRCRVASPEVTVDALMLHSPAIDIAGAGRVTLDGAADLDFQAQLKEPASLAAIAGLDTILGRGDLHGMLHRADDTLTVAGDWNLTDLKGFGLTVDSLHGTGTLILGAANSEVTGRVVARDVTTGQIRLDSLTTTARYQEGVISLQSSLALPEATHIGLSALIMRDSLLQVLIPELAVTVREEVWRNGPDTIRLSLGAEELIVENVALSNGARSIAASGILSTTGTNDFALDINRLPLSYLPALLDSFPPVRGELSAALRLEGMLPEPSFSCSLTVEGAGLSDETLRDISAAVAYLGDSTLNWHIRVVGRGGNILAAEGLLPLRHGALWDSVSIDRDRSIHARLILQDYQLSHLTPAFPHLDRLTGVATSDLSLGGTSNAPLFAGSFRIDGGAVSSATLGIAYDSITVEVAGQDTLLLLRQFRMQSDGGSVNASGILAGVSNLLGVALRPRQLDLEMLNFLAIQSPNLEIRLSGPLTLRAEGDTLRVGGDLTVPRSRLWIPAFFRQGRTAGERRTPLLLAALQAQDSTAVGVTPEPPEITQTLLRQIAGTVRARIPNNTWLQSQELNVEISGNLELTLRGPVVTIAGFAKVERGTFVVLGKKFVVREGRADFTGGVTPIPQIRMEVVYAFRRSDGIQQSLDLLITGKATNPSLTFRLNGEPLSEQDAVSYVLFGRSLDELSQSQRSSVSESTTDLAAGLAASFLTAQLSNTVGQAFGLDVLEVNVEDAGRQSSFTAGKYLSDDLYVRYTRRINDPSTNETNTDEVALEYRLLPFLYVQMIQGTSKATGYDLLIRFD